MMIAVMFLIVLLRIRILRVRVLIFDHGIMNSFEDTASNEFQVCYINSKSYKKSDDDIDGYMW